MKNADFNIICIFTPLQKTLTRKEPKLDLNSKNVIILQYYKKGCTNILHLSIDQYSSLSNL